MGHEKLLTGSIKWTNKQTDEYIIRYPLNSSIVQKYSIFKEVKGVFVYLDTKHGLSYPYDYPGMSRPGSSS